MDVFYFTEFINLSKLIYSNLLQWERPWVTPVGEIDIF